MNAVSADRLAGGHWTSVGRILQKTGTKGRGKAFVDFQNDVTTSDVVLAHEEGYESLEHLKRYTTLGMGTDQGKTSNVAAAQLMADLRGVDLSVPVLRHLSAALHTGFDWRAGGPHTSAPTSGQRAARRCMIGTSQMAPP